MKKTQDIMGMPITIEVADSRVSEKAFDQAFSYFHHVDEKFSTYKDTSEIMKINRGEIVSADYSDDMGEVLRLSEETKRETGGYFDIQTAAGGLDPSGLVKGWSIYKVADILKELGCKEYYVDAGGDIEARGRSWKIGIKNPFKMDEIVKVVYLQNQGMATSGTYLRGNHIYNPVDDRKPATEIISLTVIGPNVYEADRFATAAFAMGKQGIIFIENLPGFEGYMIDHDGIATMTTGFQAYTKEPIQQ